MTGYNEEDLQTAYQEGQRDERKRQAHAPELVSPSGSTSMVEDTDDIWRKAVDYCLIVNCIGTTDGCETVHDAVGKIAELVKWEVQIATDPKVNGGYKLVKIHSQNDNIGGCEPTDLNNTSAKLAFAESTG